ncbi:AMP-binding protein [Dietzia sp.]|uniref:AMP-binding protein n=1 Tax=Dietzia sp. TaxID=1871616 RepID=UPI002FDAC3BB
MADFNPGHTMNHATFGHMLLAREGDDSPGLLFEDGSWTWDAFVRESAVRASLLTALSETHRDKTDSREPERHKTLHVGVLLDNVPEYLFLLSGAALSGVTIIGVNPTRRGAELAADIRGAECDVLLASAEGLALLDGIGRVELGLAEEPLDVEAARWRGMLEAHAGAAADPTAQLTPTGRDEGTYLSLMFTSGSTGAPKPVICSTGRMAMLGQVNFRGLVPEDVAYSAMPLFHGNAIMGVFAPCVAVGCAFSMRRRFSASAWLGDVLRFGATFANYVGRALAYILAVPERPEEQETRLRIVFGTEASARDRAEFERRFGVAPSEAYGSSEGGAVIQRTPGTPKNALGRAGDYMDIAILDSGGNECPPARFGPSGEIRNAGEAIGEIVNRSGAAMFEGYYGRPDATAERVDGEAFHTGDLGYRDEHGFFYFAGRSADRIRVDSENFSAAPIERILSEFPGVLVAAVYPVPDPRTGDAVMAALHMSPGTEFDPAAFADFLEGRSDLGPKWRPRFVRIVPAMPTTATRKIAKPVLRRESWQVGDPVFVYDGGRHRLLDADAGRELLAEYELHGRSAAGH